MSSILAKKLTVEEMENLIITKKNWITSLCNPIRILLFGSAFRKSMSESSDIDLVLVFASEQEMSNARITLAKHRPHDDWPHDLIFCTCEHFEKKNQVCGSIYHEALVFGETIFSGVQK